MKRVGAANFPELEAEMLKTWEKEQTFEASLKLRQGAPLFRFYDGPPFTSGEPHYGHVEQSSIKDAVVRYKTMRGYYAPRRTGSDTHGLPIEYIVEKELGFTGKQDIVAYGIAKFNEACRAIVFRHKEDFDELYRRLGRWDDPKKSYATLDDDYIETVWWVFKSLRDKGLVYQGFKSIAYCPRCATPLSNFEVNDGYRDDVEDPSLYVKFKLKDSAAFMLAWTTTPWSLPGNEALAVSPAAKYVEVEVKDDEGRSEHLILAADRLEVLSEDYKMVRQMVGEELVGQYYEPLFQVSTLEPNEDLFKIWAAEFVSTAEGTGVLHVAPAFGEDDLNLGQAHGLPVARTVDSNGRMTSGIGLDEVEGLFFKKADPVIIAHLTKQNRVFAAETFTHTYPFCWRCETPLLYYAMPSWFVEVTKFRDQLVETGEQTNWIPTHVKSGRFVKWLEGARDWAVSRNRFWGAPMPIWQCADGHHTFIGSIDELKQKAMNLPGEIDLHRPGIDAIEIKCAECGQPAKRIEEVFDCWFESGSMPYGQEHYPFENKAEFEASFPADFVVEAIEQTHLWFYTLHVLATALFDQPAYKNALASGLILGADGRKLSKRLRNYPRVEEVFNEFGADVLRFFLLSSPLMTAGDTRLTNDSLLDTQRNVFLTLWNVYSFLATYAETDNWQAPKEIAQPTSQNVLDQWILARLNQTITEVTTATDGYLLARATRAIVSLVDDLSNWYLRRSRRRFSKTADAADRAAAFTTLHYVLVRTCQLLAPWSPFVSDYLFRELTEHQNGSVHLSDWPEAGEIDDGLLAQMSLVRDSVTEGLAARAAAGVKVRQPLSKVTVSGTLELSIDLQDLIKDELNVKSVEYEVVKERRAPVLNTTITLELAAEGLARDVIRQVQAKRREAGLTVGETVKLELATADPALKAAIETWRELITAETSANDLKIGEPKGIEVPVRLGQSQLEIGLTKL